MPGIERFLKRRKGYARMADMKKAGIHTREIARALASGIVVKVKPGLYKLPDYHRGAYSALADVCRANNNAVICLSSALAYHGLTTLNPSEVTVAVPHNTDRFELLYPPVRVFFFPAAFYKPGIETVGGKSARIRVYGPEKSICDMFRYRNKLGFDLAVEGLKTYLRRKDANVARLQEYAAICHVKTVMMPILKGLLA